LQRQVRDCSLALQAQGADSGERCSPITRSLRVQPWPCARTHGNAPHAHIVNQRHIDERLVLCCSLVYANGCHGLSGGMGRWDEKPESEAKRPPPPTPYPSLGILLLKHSCWERQQRCMALINTSH
ncbi:hypothetical protein JZ751_020715, partial [Albula glossodonta]